MIPPQVSQASNQNEDDNTIRSELTLYEEMATKLNLESKFIQHPYGENPKDPVMVISKPPHKPSHLITWFITMFNIQLNFPETILGSILQFKLKIQSISDIADLGNLPLGETVKKIVHTWSNSYPEPLTEFRIACKFIGSKIYLERNPF